jgi:hypothetical protein
LNYSRRENWDGVLFIIFICAEAALRRIVFTTSDRIFLESALPVSGPCALFRMLVSGVAGMATKFADTAALTESRGSIAASHSTDHVLGRTGEFLR